MLMFSERATPLHQELHGISARRQFYLNSGMTGPQRPLHIL